MYLIILVINMVNITLSVSNEIYEHMQQYPELRWSEVARKSIIEKLREMELLDDLKACEEGEKAIARGEYISHKQLLKEMGIK